MKIRIDRSILLEALQVAVTISPKITSEPIIANILLGTEGDDNISIKATNHENSVSGVFEATVEQQGNICVNTSKFFNIVKEFRANLVEIESTPQNWVYISCGHSKIKLPGVEPDQFPVIEFRKTEKEFSLPPSILKKAIDRTYFAIGDNESRKNLMGLNLNIVSSNLIRWTGADSFRISQYNTELEEDIFAEGNIIIPKKSLPDIKRILEYSNGKITASLDDSIFQIFSGSVKYKTRLIEAEFPNLDRLVNAATKYSVNISKEELINAVRILSTVTEGDQKSVVKLTFQEEQVILESQKLEFGEGNDVIACDYMGEPMSIGLNIRFLLDAIQVFDPAESENIVLNMSRPDTPFIVSCEDWENYRTVLMPVKIQW